jgi:hypothetical protein
MMPWARAFWETDAFPLVVLGPLRPWLVVR